MRISHGTNYFQKTLDDLISCLQNWAKEAKNGFEFIEKTIDKGAKKYISEKYPDFGILIENTHELLKTSNIELLEISQNLQSRVQETHYRRLLTLGREFSNTNKALGKLWNSNYIWHDPKKENFQKLQITYSKTRDCVVSISEVGDLAERLKEFIGLSSQSNLESSSEENLSLEKIRTLIAVEETQKDNGYLVINKDFPGAIKINPYAISKHIEALCVAIKSTDKILSTEDIIQCKDYLNFNKQCLIYRDQKTSHQKYLPTPILVIEEGYGGRKLKISPSIKTEVISNGEYRKRLASKQSKKKRLN